MKKFFCRLLLPSAPGQSKFADQTMQIRATDPQAFRRLHFVSTFRFQCMIIKRCFKAVISPSKDVRSAPWSRKNLEHFFRKKLQTRSAAGPVTQVAPSGFKFTNVTRPFVCVKRIDYAASSCGVARPCFSAALAASVRQPRNVSLRSRNGATSTAPHFSR